MFTLGEGVTMLDQTNLPGYIKKAYTGSKQGVMFSAGKEGALINYNGVIDLRDTSFYTGQSVRDMNSQDLRQEFLEMLVTPLDNSAKEFQTLEVRLTDIYDSNNYLTISIAAGDKRYTVPASSLPSRLQRPADWATESIPAMARKTTGKSMSTPHSTSWVLTTRITSPFLNFAFMVCIGN